MEDLDNSGRTAKRRTLDLSLTQVAASALAAVVGAVLASQLGVYGTILGAAVVSLGATVGTAVLSHLFRRTGEQLREIAAAPNPVESTHPADQPEPVHATARPATKELRAGGTAASTAEGFDPFDPGGERTRMMARIDPPDANESVAVYRGRTTWRPRSWKVLAITATLVFAIAMGAVGVIQLVSEKPLLTGGNGSGGGSGGNTAPKDPSGGSDQRNSDGAKTGSGSGTSDGTQSKGDGSPGTGGSPQPDPSGSPHSTPTPGPSTTPDPGAGAGTGGGSSGGGSSNDGTAPGAGSAASGDAAAPKAPASP